MFKFTVKLYAKNAVDLEIAVAPEKLTNSTNGMKIQATRFFKACFDAGVIDDHDVAALDFGSPWNELRQFRIIDDEYVFDGKLLGYKRDFGVCWCETMFAEPMAIDQPKEDDNDAP